MLRGVVSGGCFVGRKSDLGWLNECGNLCDGAFVRAGLDNASPSSV